ncbi:MAG: ABC transporter ATP-binding protein [Candidatus Competibacteraceae bacterium]
MLIVRKLSRTGLLPISFELAKGECVVIQGPSGSGKTLLLQAIADLDPNHGQVSLAGRLRETWSGPAWRRRVVYVPAESGWWASQVGEHFSAWENARPLIENLRLPATVRLAHPAFIDRRTATPCPGAGINAATTGAAAG